MTPTAAAPAMPRILTRLSTRDRQLLRLFDEHQVFTAQQVYELAYRSARHARERLTTLYRIGVLARFRNHRPVGSEPWKYTLAPLGAAIVAHEQGVQPPTPAKINARVAALSVSQRLRHLLGVNGFFTALAQAARTAETRCALSDWWSEKRCAQLWGNTVRPDAYGQWQEQDRTVEFWLEYDNGTETLTRLRDKITGYADLAIALGRPVLLLFWMPGPHRETNTRRALASAPPGVEIVTANSAHGTPADPVWLPLDQSTRVPIGHLHKDG